MDPSPGKITAAILATVLMVLVGLLIVINAVNGGGSNTFLVVECDGEEHRYSLPSGGLTIEYNWTHSVEGTIIVEVYNATIDGLILVKVLTQSFGAGHPYSAEELGGSFYMENGYMVYTSNYNIGYSLEIEGPPEYSNYIKVGGSKVCEGFRHALVRVVTP